MINDAYRCPGCMYAPCQCTFDPWPRCEGCDSEKPSATHECTVWGCPSAVAAPYTRPSKEVITVKRLDTRATYESCAMHAVLTDAFTLDEPVTVTPTEELTKLLKHVVGLLRADTGPASTVAECSNCRYKGPFATMDCACYEDYAPSCRPTSRGPGCSNGAPYCPVCQDDSEPPNVVDVAEALMTVEKFLGDTT